VTVVGTLLESKYRVPGRRAGAVDRPRLTAALHHARRSSLTLLSAPAGFGKTTLLTEWLATVPHDEARVAWLSLDHRDNEPVLFWTYVLSAIAAAENGIGAEALTLLAASSSSAEAALAALLNDLDGLSTDLLLVLDDYHLVEASDVHDGMRFLLEHQPATLHVVLATRADPPLALAKLRADGRLAEVRAADLRFTAEESQAYLNGPMGLELTGADIMTLDGRTEGWIAALQLAALSMQGRDDVTEFIAGFAGDDRHIVDYLAEEVLARQAPDVRGFLLRTSVLERLTGSLCDAVSGRDDGRSMLVALEKANLFLVPLDDRRRWYRYHHLFAEVLQGHLREELPEEVSALHRRASVWLAEHGDTSQAVAHALAGGDDDRAADLMETAMPVMTRERREAELGSWVRSVPDEVVRARPVLGVAFVGVLAQVSDFGAVGPRLDDIEHTLRPHGGPWPAAPPPGVVVVDEEAYRSLPARVEMYRAALSLADADPAGTIAHATDALSLAPPDDGLTRAAAGALAGLASWAGGDLAGAHAAYTESIAGLRRVGFVADVLGCCITLGDIRCVQGRLEDAMDTYRWALDLAASASVETPLRGTADMHVGMAGVLVERDDLAAAASHLDTSSRLGEANGLPQNRYRWRVVMARVQEAQGNLDGALDLLDDAVRTYAGDYSPNVRPVPAVRARLRLRRGEQSHAEAWVRERGLAAGDELAYLTEYEHVTLARVLLARHRAAGDDTSLAEALSLLGRLREAVERGERGGTLVEVLVLTSLARQTHGDLSGALDALQLAVELAEPEGYVRLFADEGPPMASLLKALTQRGVARAYAQRLLVATAAGQPHATRPQGLVDPLSERELDVLRLLGTDLGGPDIARELFISLNTLRTHTKNIYAKLGVTSRRGAVTRAHDLHLFPSRRAH
jgi:LuxR family maltose regulon positive regulatory protein